MKIVRTLVTSVAFQVIATSTLWAQFTQPHSPEIQPDVRRRAGFELNRQAPEGVPATPSTEASSLAQLGEPSPNFIVNRKQRLLSEIEEISDQFLGVLGVVSGGPIASPRLQSEPTFSAQAQTHLGSALLYLDQTQLATPGTTLWLVADLSQNGIPSGQVSAAQISDIANGIGDDRSFYTDTVPGQLTLGTLDGKYQRVGINVPTSYAGANIGLVLWNDANGNHTIGDAGDTFGYYNFGVVPVPQSGNAVYEVATAVHADQNLVTAVPEPMATAAAVGALCLAGAAARTIKRRTHREAA